MTLRERILQDTARPAGCLDLGEYGGPTVYLRRWTLADQLRVRQLADDKDRPHAERSADLLRLCLCDKDGSPVFGPDDAGALAVPFAVADRVIDATLAANGLTGDAAEKKATSPPTPSSGSSSGSPSSGA